MKIVIGESVNPYFNLAMEEYFLKEKEEDFFMLWRNDKAVIIGKNQNAYAEINHNYVTENNIKVVRRMTGGGAVFHDLGNINYTFIKRNSKESFSDYKSFSQPIIAFLKTLGVDAHLSGRNDMLIEDKKFSGNAQFAYKDSVMHHGTLLFSSDVSDINESLNVNPLKISSKGIASVKSRVTNICEHLREPMLVEDFISQLVKYILEDFDDSEIYNISVYDCAEIEKLVNEKYLSHDWNYGFKPEFMISNEKKFDYGIVQINFSIKNNIIEKIKIFGDFFGINDIAELENKLKGVLYKEDAVNNLLGEISLDNYIKGISVNDFLNLIFNIS